jgi:hypothetical protein
MKPLDKCTNTEKARLLHQLFPNEIPELLQFVQGVCKTIQEDEQSNRTAWKNGLFTLDFWFSLVNEIDAKIKQFGKQLHRSSYVFADQLFDSYLAYYMVHCLLLFTTVQQHPNRAFTKAVDLLFNV